MIMYNMLIQIIHIFIFSSFYECFCEMLFFLYIQYKKYDRLEKVHNKIR